MTSCYAIGHNANAEFTLKVHRGESMVLLGMNWREGTPPPDFVGFAIEYKEPDGKQFYVLKNRLSFEDQGRDDATLSTRQSPIQKFRWVHFPRRAELAGNFVYRVTPVFMSANDALRYGEPQEAEVELGLETFKDELNIAFTRGFVSSQAFSDRFLNGHEIDELLPELAKDGLNFKPSHPDAKNALEWMGFEARNAILAVLDEAIADTAAKVCVIAYDLNEPEVLQRLRELKSRVRVIIDDSSEHRGTTTAETQAEQLLRQSAGSENVIRQHMGNLQHNKTIVVNGPKCQAVVCGSTNFSWRGFFIQANNAIVLRGSNAVAVFEQAFEGYWGADDKNLAPLKNAMSTNWNELRLPSVKAMVTFSPHDTSNAVLDTLADHVLNHTESNILFALAFLYQTEGSMRDAISSLSSRDDVFVYGMSDRAVGIDLRTASGHMAIVRPAMLGSNTSAPFKREISGGRGIRLHHKFIVTDFDKPHARVYMGSFNFSPPADLDNGEHLIVIENQRVATAYMVEALRLFDHYEFRVKDEQAKSKGKPLRLSKPPRTPDEKAWWDEDWRIPLKIKDRELFS